MITSPEQRAALEAIATWYRDPRAPQLFRLFGPAGTGKTTIAKQVASWIGVSDTDIFFAAFTGKAASILTSKGCPNTSTLHSLVLLPSEECSEFPAPCLTRNEECTECNVNGRCKGHCRKRKRKWVRNPDSMLRTAKLLIVDEVSMVDEFLAKTVMSFGTKILCLGDPAQLPPIRGFGYCIDAEPDFELREIHRQAGESPILDLATRIRTNRTHGLGIRQTDYTPHSKVDYLSYDMVLCWRRETRWNAINFIRKMEGRHRYTPSGGDKVICLANDYDLGIFNGQMFQVEHFEPVSTGVSKLWCYEMDAFLDPGAELELREFEVYDEGFDGLEGETSAMKKRLGSAGEVALFTFGQALTVHKSQGSEWSKVLLIDEVTAPGCNMKLHDKRKWLYTGVTRASQELTLRKGKTR